MINNLKAEKCKRLKIIILLFIGLLCVLYPTITNIWNNYRQNKIISIYSDKIKNQATYESDINKAKEYNRSISMNQLILNNNMKDLYYESLLNINDDLTMGYIVIPKLSLKLSIYHYYNSDNINGVGHLYGSSLPIGGMNTHCLLAAHSGLASSSLFTNLNKLQIEDIFYIVIPGDVLCYKVSTIKTVLPNDLSSLNIEENRDLVTLITCTPYAVNSHRLLVTGERINYKIEDFNKINNLNYNNIIIDNNQILGLCIIVLVITFLVFKNKRTRKHEK